MLHLIFVLSLALVYWSQIAFALEQEKIDQLTDLMVKGCSLGQSIGIEIEADGSISILKKGGKGHFKATKDEIPSIIKFLGSDHREVANDTRECMQRYMDRIFDVILPPKSSKAHAAEKEACVQFAGTIPESKQRALEEAKRQALSEFYGEFIRSKSQTEDFKFDSSLISSVAIGIVRVQGSPEYYNGKSLGEVCTKATFFITKDDTEQMKPQTAQLENYCVTDETLPLPKLMEAFQFRSQRAGLSRINPRIQEASDKTLMTLTSNFAVTKERIDFQSNALCGNVSFTYVPLVVRAFENDPEPKAPLGIHNREAEVKLLPSVASNPPHSPKTVLQVPLNLLLPETSLIPEDLILLKAGSSTNKEATEKYDNSQELTKFLNEAERENKYQLYKSKELCDKKGNIKYMQFSITRLNSIENTLYYFNISKLHMQNHSQTVKIEEVNDIGDSAFSHNYVWTDKGNCSLSSRMNDYRLTFYRKNIIVGIRISLIDSAIDEEEIQTLKTELARSIDKKIILQLNKNS